MNPEEIHKYLISQHRNIYQEASLFHQNRRPVDSYLDVLADPFDTATSLQLKQNSLSSSTNSYPITNHVIDFRKKHNDHVSEKWDELNATLVNYQKFLTPYVLLNSLPIYNYIGHKTGLNKLKNARVADIGAGTGQIYGTFFHHQESVEYFLVDPNLRLLHDQFLRLYPKLSEYPLAHILSYAENLPFKNETMDLVMSISSIDHFKDYKQFIAEANRVSKPGGFILIASHLDADIIKTEKKVTPPELIDQNAIRSFKDKVWNRLAFKSEFNARKYHNKKRGHVPDDHMHHFENTQILEDALKAGGYKVEQAEVFQRNFFIKAKKV